MPTEPDQLALVKKHIELVDDAPHPAMLYDGHPTIDNRPSYLKNLTRGGGLHQQQIEKLKGFLAQEGKTWDDPLIKRAYNAKLKKTQDALEVTRQMETSGANLAFRLRLFVPAFMWVICGVALLAAWPELSFSSYHSSDHSSPQVIRRTSRVAPRK